MIEVEIWEPNVLEDSTDGSGMIDTSKGSRARPRLRFQVECQQGQGLESLGGSDAETCALAESRARLSYVARVPRRLIVRTL